MDYGAFHPSLPLGCILLFKIFKKQNHRPFADKKGDMVTKGKIYLIIKCPIRMIFLGTKVSSQRELKKREFYASVCLKNVCKVPLVHLGKISSNFCFQKVIIKETHYICMKH